MPRLIGAERRSATRNTQSAAATQGDPRALTAEDHTTALALLDERRVNLAQTRVRAMNRLHALLPGDTPTELSATQAMTKDLEL